MICADLFVQSFPIAMCKCEYVQIIYRFIEGWQKNCTYVFEIDDI